MADNEVLYEVADHVATIWFNRPERRNAATFDMADQFREALAKAEADDDVRVIVLAGKGDHFCAGDDVQGAWGDPRMEQTMAELADVRPPMTPEVAALLDCLKPTIAAVNGAAVGSGMDFALNCDIIIASDTAKFGQLFIRMGLMCDITGLWRLPQIVGHSRAAEMLFTGETILADEAERIGLVSRVVASDKLMPTTLELAERIAGNAPLAVRHIKEGLRRATGRTRPELDELASFVGSGLARLFSSQDHAEAVSAFIQKRPAEFKGR